MNDYAKRVAQSYIYYPKRISKYLEYDYGILYYDTDNPQSHMCNHAVITDLYDVEDRIYKVTKFYLDSGLMPVIYTPFIKGAYETMYGTLKTLGYTFGRYPNGGFFYYPSSDYNGKNKTGGRINIKRVTTFDKQIEDILEDDEESRHNIVTIKKLIGKSCYYLWALYLKDKPVSIASIGIMDEYGCSAVDHVFTKPEYRNKGYATAVVKHAVNMHNKISNNLVYLYAYKRQPVRIYRKIGFVKISDLDYWNAWLT